MALVGAVPALNAGGLAAAFAGRPIDDVKASKTRRPDKSG
jgi:hypothetical protein